MIASTLVSAALLFLGAVRSAAASSCVVFDSNMNLYAFGLNGKDYNAGPQESWSSSTPAKDITSSSGRPPFDGAKTTCYLSQYFNTMYVLGADASDATAVHIFDATKAAWTVQKVDAASIDANDMTVILDHDTNVFFALSKGSLSLLRMEKRTAGDATALAWEVTGTAAIKTESYSPVMAIAQNHIHFLDVPGNTDGQASIFVIHFSYWQPEVQTYPASSGSSFPATHGQVASLFQPTDSGKPQQEFAFIPDNGSNTFIVNVENNSTTPLAPPPTTDAGARYAAGVEALVQITGKGEVNWMPYAQGKDDANKAAKWAPVANIAAAAPASTGNPSGSASGSGSGSGAAGPSKTGGASPSKSGSPSVSGSGAGSSPTGAASTVGAAMGMTGAIAMAVAAFLA